MNEGQKSRPTSPHLSIYRWQIGNTLSIMHRISGAGLYASIHILAWYFILSNNMNCDLLRSIGEHILFKLMLILSLIGYMYHTLNGIRHLAWDAGYGYDLPVMRATGKMVIAGTVIFTIISIIYITN